MLRREKNSMDKNNSKAGEEVSAGDRIANLRARGETEPIAAFLGVRLVELTEGYAKVAMKLRPEYANFLGGTFGGIIMSVADEAFAYATNSVITPNVASQFNIHFVAAPDLNDELIGECRVVKAGKRVCISEMKVTNQDGRLIANATGTTIPIIRS
jgi:acyl-CoA thioesterase